MPSLDDDGWELESAEARHAEHPDQFLIPSLAERASLRIGDRVKLLFLFLTEEPDGTPIVQCERMWVTVSSSAEKGYVGTLESLPTSSEALSPGARVEFDPAHVAAITR
jgi:hypothetical protein